MQNFHNFLGSDYLSDVPQQLNGNFESVASDFRGFSFPTENLIVGMRCLRSDQNAIYRLCEDASNNLVWVKEYSLLESGGVKVTEAVKAEQDRNGNALVGYEIATKDEAKNGTDNTKIMTPLGVSLAQGSVNRLSQHSYKENDVVYHKSNLQIALKCTATGTTSAEDVDFSSVKAGQLITDGSVVWMVVARSNSDTFSVIRCSDAGMTTDDKDGKNLAILKSLVNSGSRILVDDFYVIKGISPVDVTCDLYIHGEKKGCGFNFLVGGDLFVIHERCGNVELSNLRLVGQERIFLLKADGENTNENIKLDKLIFTDNICEDHIRAVQFTGSLTSKPSLASYGIQKIELSRNVCTNIYHHFFIVHNLPIGHCECIANKVTNFNHYFLGCMVNNDHSFVEDMQRQLGSFEIAYNVVQNTDDWWVPDKDDLYLCFAIIEANQVYYHNNHVEGLKCDHSLKTTDAIFYSNHVVSRNNVWKNNLCFDTSYYGGEIFSSKAGGVKFYEDNSYVVEEDWLERIGKTANDYNIRLIEVVATSEWHIRRNKIIMPHLELLTTGLLYTEFEFCDNVVRLDSATGALLTNSRLSTYENPAICVFKGNEFEVQSGDVNSFYYNGDSSAAYTGQRVLIENNSIRVNADKLCMLRSDNRLAVTDFLKFDNNTIINDGERTVLCSTAFSINQLIGNNKLISGKDDTLRCFKVKQNSRYEHTYSFDTLSQVTSPLVEFTDDYPSVTKLVYDIYEGLDNSWHIELGFELFEEDGVKKIKYKVGDSGVTVKLLHPSSSEYISLNTGDCPLTFTLYLSSGGTSVIRCGISRTIQAGEIVEKLMMR